MNSTENDIRELIRKGDKAAFEKVFRQFYKSLCSYALFFVHDTEDADEVVQEVFYKLWKGHETIDIQSSLKSYLFRAVHNQCLNQLKQQKYAGVYAEHQKPLLENEQKQHANPAELKELSSRINEAINKLPPERKKVFLMIRFEGMKYKDVANVLGISIKTVENQMGKAMQFLKEELHDYLPLIALVFSFFFKSR